MVCPRQITAKFHGFSLIELLVVIVIFLVVTQTVQLQYPAIKNSFSRRDAREQLLFDVRRAQAESISEGARGIFSFSADNSSYIFGFDYLPYSVTLIPDQQVFIRVLPEHITINRTVPVLFNQKGQLINSAGRLSSSEVRLLFKGERFLTATLSPTGAMIITNNAMD